jgi:hypothetical protein
VATAFAVQTTAPLDQAVVNAPVARIVATFTQDVDASLVNDTTIMLERLGAAGSVAGQNALPAAKVLAENNPAVLLITPRAALDAGVYRVTVRGTGAAALANMNAVTLGADVTFEFTVVPAQ